MQEKLDIKAIIGLGNPGKKYERTRHNIGFRVVDLLAQQSGSSWRTQDDLVWTTVQLDDHAILLVKPQTGMNLCGKVLPFLQKKGIKPEQILVVHDELELPFGTLKLKQGGSARGHNGLRSLISVSGPDFYRLRFGISRPEERDHVSDYVLSPFAESADHVEAVIVEAADQVKQLLLRSNP